MRAAQAGGINLSDGQALSGSGDNVAACVPHIDIWTVFRQHRVMLGGLKNQFPLTRAALNLRGTKKQFPISRF